MIRRVNNFSLVPCLVLSMILHSLVVGILLYKNKSENVYMQAPFEVSFYSPIQTKAPQIVEQKEEIKPVEETKPVEEVKPEIKKKKKKKEINKDTIVVKKTEKEKKEETKKEPKEEQPVEKQNVEEKKQSSEGSGAVATSNKGIMLENKNFKFSFYTSMISKKIGKKWQWSSVTSSYRAVVYFRIARDGSVYDVKIKESSSDQDFDQNAIRAIELAGPFAPLPAAFEDKYLGVYFEFKFN